MTQRRELKIRKPHSSSVRRYRTVFFLSLFDSRRTPQQLRTVVHGAPGRGGPRALDRPIYQVVKATLEADRAGSENRISIGT